MAFVFNMHEEGSFHVFHQIAEIQKAALRDLYDRIEQIVKSMNGTSTEMEVNSSLPDQMCDGPSNLSVTALHVELPNGCIVDFKPSHPLGFGNALCVSARTNLLGGFLKDVGFSFIDGKWQSGGQTLSDEVIRGCLTSRGPVPID